MLECATYGLTADMEDIVLREEAGLRSRRRGIVRTTAGHCARLFLWARKQEDKRSLVQRQPIGTRTAAPATCRTWRVVFLLLSSPAQWQFQSSLLHPGVWRCMTTIAWPACFPDGARRQWATSVRPRWSGHNATPPRPAALHCRGQWAATGASAPQSVA